VTDLVASILEFATDPIYLFQVEPNARKAGKFSLEALQKLKVGSFLIASDMRKFLRVRGTDVPKIGQDT
jgi:hypothetical protein